VSCNTKLIGIKHLPAYFTAVMSTKFADSSLEDAESLRLDHRVMKTEKECIIKALKEYSNNKSKAIKALKISRSTFYEKLRKHNIESVINTTSV
jgi:DNA-binding NtrC family response regulator